MSLGGGQTQTPVANSNKYAQIMELMRRRNAMNNSTYTGGFNAYPVAPPPRPYSDLIARQASADRGFGPEGGSELGRGGSDGYGRNSSPLSSPMKGSFGYQALDAYGNLLGGMLPFGLLAQTIAQSMNPSQVEEAGKLSAQAMSDAIKGYASGEMFGAPPSDPSTFAGGGYGISIADGGYGKTSATGAGIAANPMSRDPQQAAQDIANANAAASAAAAIADAAEAEGVALGPAATGDVGGTGVGGAGYGTSVADGGYGVTGMTGAGVASTGGVGVDPATAQGQQADGSDGRGSSGEPEGGGMQGNSGGNFSGGFGDGFGDGGEPEGGGDGGGGFGDGYYKGGKVTMNRLQGPNPMGPDDGYGALKDGEFVMNPKSVGKYGIELMNAINAGKISKGKLRGLLEA